MIPDTGLPSSDPFDALADLFLGELGRVAAHDVALGLPPIARAQAAHNAAGDPPPRPTRESPAAVAAPAGPRLTLVHHDLHEHFDPPAAHATVQPESTPRESSTSLAPIPGPMIEALVLGHLPVLASAWAARYVRHAAEQEGRPVGLIRLAGGQVRVELVPVPGGSPQSNEPSKRVSNLHDAWSLLLHACDRIVIHADAEHEPALVASAMVDEVTLLSAADEAAVVNAYRTLKLLAGRTGGALGEQASLRVAVMGAPEARARYVWSRLEEAAESFLGRPLRCAGLIGQITGGSPSQILFIGPCTGSAAEVVSQLTSSPARRPEPAARPAAPEPIEHPVLYAEAEEDDWSFAMPDQPSPSTGPDSLAELIPGLTPLRARCPLAESVELAIDLDGGLHVLAGAGSSADSSVISALTTAAGWASLNRRVLQLTLPQGSPALKPTTARLHLFTDRPAAHRGLLDSCVQVHLLAAVPARQTAGWMAAALN
jgi:hypothetical protein